MKARFLLLFIFVITSCTKNDPIVLKEIMSEFSYVENQNKGDVLIELSKSSEFIGDNYQLYSLNEYDYFEIDPKTGSITLNTELRNVAVNDFETLPNHFELIIQFSDLLNEVKQKKIILNIIDVLDEIPEGYLRVPEQFESIQKAIDSAEINDTILVGNGIYPENIVLNKKIHLISNYLISRDEKEIANTIIDKNGSGLKQGTGIKVLNEGSGSSIQGFTIRNFDDGISSFGIFNIIKNIIIENVDGIDFENNSGGIIKENILIFNDDDGIDLDDGIEVIISNNQINYNQDDGIEIRLQPNDMELKIQIKKNNIQGNLEDGIQIISYNERTEREIIISENLIYNNKFAGIGIMGDGNTIENFEAYQLKEDLLLFNNTVSTNEIGISGGGAETYLVNNIIYNNKDKDVKAKTILNGTNNIYLKGNPQLIGGTIFQDPLLDNKMLITQNSPAIDKGVNGFDYRDEFFQINITTNDGKLDLGHFQFEK